MSRKRKREESSSSHERWLITYADLITLLLIFFVVLYSMGKIDIAKYEVMARSLQMEFKKSDSILPQNAGIMGSLDPGKGTEGDQKEENLDTSLHSHEEKLQDLLRIVNEYIEEHNLGEKVFATDIPRGISIKLSDKFLFDLGKADLRTEGLPVLEKLASLFPTLDAKISIEGHTDDLPLATGSFYRDNWGLSQARSLSVLRYFIYTAKLDDRNFISAGYADTEPVAPNNSNENRQKNRRVEIVVLRDILPHQQSEQ